MRRRLAAITLAVAMVLTGCSSTGSDDLPELAGDPEQEATNGSSSTPLIPVTCDEPRQSYEPLDPMPAALQMPAGSTMAQIQERGALVVGVSADTLMMGSRNPFTGKIEGFDIDMLREVSRAIFGDPDRLQFRVITSAQRIDVLQSGEVDIVARAFTITCARWQEIAFSSVYYEAGQKVLVAAASGAQGLDDLGGQRVCAPEGTTTLRRLHDFPDVEVVPAPTHGQCLALFQQGQVDAITGDDTVLAGFAAQDPYAVVVGEAISAEPYGLGIATTNTDLVRFVNGVIKQLIDSGTWTTIYERWLSDLGPAPDAPVAIYGR